MRIGSKIESLRTKRKLSLDELSEKTNISKSTLADYESGNDGKISNLLKIAEALNVPVSELIDETNVQVNNINENESVCQINFNININVQDENQAKRILESLHPSFKK